MIELMQKVEFWIAMIFAMIIKFRTSPKLTVLQALFTVVTAICGALLFTEPAYHWFGFTGDTGKFACCAVVALMCEHIASIMVRMTLAEFIAMWRLKQ